MSNFLKFSLGVIAGYLISGSVAHFILTHQQEEKHPPAWLPMAMTVEDIMLALAEMERTNPSQDFVWPIPHIAGGCFFCGGCFYEGEPLPEEQTLGGIRVKICSECAQIVTSEPC